MTHGLFQRIEDRARRVWRKHLLHRLPEERGGRRVEPLGGWCVVPVDATFGVNLEHEIRKRGQRRVKVRVRLLESLLGRLAFGDVARRAPPAHEAAALHHARDVVECPHGPSFPVLRRDLDVREPVPRADGFRHETDLVLVRSCKKARERDSDQFVGALETIQLCKRTIAES
jgi:hypothetical protein